MKKNLAALLLAALMCLVLTACGSAPQGGSAGSGSSSKGETVVVSVEDYSISIVDRQIKSESGNSDEKVPTLTMLIENKSDKNLEFFFDQVYLNGYSVDVHHNPESGISTWPVIVNADKKCQFDLACLTDVITDESEIVDFEARLTVKEVLEMSQYYDKSEKTAPFAEHQIVVE